jgi:hypothetical protein
MRSKEAVRKGANRELKTAAENVEKLKDVNII